ncbi:hypothetical protein BGZ94_003177, partial [Podila epigama]
MDTKEIKNIKDGNNSFELDVGSVNVLHEQGNDLPPVSAAIRAYSVSVSGRFVATLSNANSFCYIDLWELEAPSVHTSNLWKTKQRVASAMEPWAQQDLALELSVSWDGAQVAVFSVTTEDGQSPLPFQFYTLDTNFYFSPRTHLLKKMTPPLRNYSTFCGYAKFVRYGQDELLVACDGLTVSAYSTRGPWTCLYSLQLTHSRDLEAAKFLVNSAQGPWILWPSHERAFVWQRETGDYCSALSTAQHDATDTMQFLASDDESIFLKIGHQIHLYSAHSGMRLQAWDDLPETTSDRETDSSMKWSYPTDISGLYRFLNDSHSVRLLAEHRCLIPDLDPPYSLHHNDISGRTIVTRICGSILYMYYMESLALQLDGRAFSPCISDCRKNVFKVKEVTNVDLAGFRITATKSHPDFVGPRGYLTVDVNDAVVAPGITADMPERTVLKLMGDYHWLLEKHGQIVSYDQGVLSIWNLPESIDNGECVLLRRWANIPGADSLSEDAPSFYTCPHQRELVIEIQRALFNFSVLAAYDRDNADYFLGGVSQTLERLFHKKSDGAQENAEVRYILAHINVYPDPCDDAKSVMSVLCQHICSVAGSKAVYERYLELADSILQTPGNVRWVPRTKYTPGGNPLSILLKKTQSQPLVMDIAIRIMEWCQKHAEREQRLEYLYYILECMPELVKHHRTEALRITRWFAYFHVADRKYTIQHHAVAMPPSISRLWRSKGPDIFDCRHPLLQFHYNPNIPEPKNDYFTEDVFVAPFTLLWSAENPHGQRRSQDRQEHKPGPLMRIVHFAMYQLNPFGGTFVHSHNYKLEMLNNPAIEALIQYKWNTFAYTLWFARFCSQFCFYLLVIIAAVMQVYSDDPDSLRVVFIAIIAFSAALLVLEISQMQLRKGFSQHKEDWKGGSREWTVPIYFRTLYNYLDLLAFIFPMVASCNQLKHIQEKNANGATWDL